MATDMQRLIVALEARTNAFEKAMNRANGVANQRARAIESRFAKMNASIGTSLAGAGKRFVAAAAAAVGARELAQLSDSATRITNALKVAGLSGDELESIYGKLRDSAVKNAAPLEALVELYSKAAMVQSELGVESGQLTVFTDRVALALRVSGKTAQESSGALLQLSQALGSGVVRAEEFSSILEGAPTILQAAAAGIIEAEGSVSKLRNIMLDGKLSSRALFDGFIAGSDMLADRAANMDLTIGQAFGNLNTALIDAAWEFNNATGAADSFAEGVNNVAQAISDFDVTGFIQKISSAGGAMDQFAKNIANSDIMLRFAELMTGQDLELGKPIDLETAEAENKVDLLFREIRLLEELIEKNKSMAIDTTEAQAQLGALFRQVVAIQNAAAGVGSMSGQSYKAGTPGDPNALAQRAVAPPAAPTMLEPISIKSYPVTGGGKGGGKGGGRSKQNDWQREVEQITERTDALLAETNALSKLNPLVDDYGYSLERAKAVHDLLTAAQKAGVAVTPELYDKIEQLADGYARASVEAEKLAESQDRARQNAEEMRDLGKDVLGGFIRDLRDGKSAAEALSGALNKIGDKLLDIGLNALFGGSGGGLGIFGKIFGFEGGGVASGGAPVSGGKPLRRFAKGGVSRTAAIFGEAGPEAAVPLPDGRTIPVTISTPRIPPQQRSSAAPPINITINAPGADAAALERVRNEVRELGRNIPKLVDARTDARQTRRTRA